MTRDEFQSQYDNNSQFKEHFDKLPSEEQKTVIGALTKEPNTKYNTQSLSGGDQPHVQEPNTIDNVMPYYKPAVGAMLGAGAGSVLPAAGAATMNTVGPMADAGQAALRALFSGTAGAAGSAATDLATGSNVSPINAVVAGGTNAALEGVPGLLSALMKRGVSPSEAMDALHAIKSPGTFSLKKLLMGGEDAAPSTPRITPLGGTLDPTAGKYYPPARVKITPDELPDFRTSGRAKTTPLGGTLNPDVSPAPGVNKGQAASEGANLKDWLQKNRVKIVRNPKTGRFEPVK